MDKLRTIEGVIHILNRSVSVNEQALSKLMEVKAEEIKGFVGENLDFPLQPSNKEILQYNYYLNCTLDLILLKENLNIKKLEIINYLELISK